MKAEFREKVWLQGDKESNWERVGMTWGLNLLELRLLRPHKKKQLHSNIVGLTHLILWVSQRMFSVTPNSRRVFKISVCIHHHGFTF